MQEQLHNGWTWNCKRILIANNTEKLIIGTESIILGFPMESI